MRASAKCPSWRLWPALLVCLTPAFAATKFVDLRPFLNADLTAYTRGGSYPQSGGRIAVNGAEFTLEARPNGHTGIVQAPSDSALHIAAQTGANGWKEHGFSFDTSILVNETSVESVDVLMNSAFGRCGTKIGELIFVAGKHESYRYPLVEGKNIRDHNYGSFCNKLAEFQGEANYGNVRLDFQRIVLPPKFDGNLQSIVFRGISQDPYDGAPFIAAITLNVSTPQTSSTISYGAPVADPASACLTNAHPCTPSSASITKEAPNRYRVLLPANLVLGAAIPNPNHNALEVQIEESSVCLGGSPTACISRTAKQQAAGPGYLNPALPPGALMWLSIGTDTVFTVNGRTADEVPIPNTSAKIFQGYEGGVAFEVTIR